MLKKPEHYVEIDATDIVDRGINLCFSYCVLFEPTLEEVISLHLKVKDMMIFIFTEKDLTEWEGLPASDHIVRPFMVAGMKTSQMYELATAIVIAYTEKA